MAEGLPKDDVRDRIAASFKRLATNTKALNKASDGFGEHVDTVELHIRNLNVGLEAWEMGLRPCT